MAKQMVNPVERHLEKAVLGVAALAVVYVIARYLVTSPNKIELGSQTVTPGTVDSVVAGRASDIAEQLGSRQPPTTTPEPLFDDFAATLSPLAPEPLAATVPFQPPVPIIDPPIDRTGRAELVTVLRPDKPKVASGRSTISLTRDDRQTFLPVNWATVSALFDYKKQVELQKRVYGATQADIVILPPEIQRRRAHPDGTWSEGDWQDVTPWPAPVARVPEPPQLILRDGPDGAKSLAADSQRSLEEFVKKLGDLPSQREWLRPLMVPTVNGTRWSFPILTTYMDVRKQDEQFLKPNDAPSPNPDDVYGLDLVTTASTGPEPQTQAQMVDAELKQIEALLASAVSNNSPEDAIRAYNKAGEIAGSTIASASQKGQAENLKKRADQTQKDIERKLKTDPRLVRGGPGKQETVVKREPLPVQQVWAHDAALDSLQDDATYQYRMRFRIYNQFAGAPERLENPEDAAKVVLAGEWSEPSEPVAFEPVSLFFVVYDDRPKEEIGVEFFRWYYGVWLKSRRARLGIGDAVRIEHRQDAPGLSNPEELDQPMVEWSADRTIVDLDFSRKTQERKTGRGTGGVSLGQPRDDTVAVLMRPDGELEERFVSVDRDHPAKRDATAKVWSPRRGGP